MVDNWLIEYLELKYEDGEDKCKKTAEYRFLLDYA